MDVRRACWLLFALSLPACDTEPPLAVASVDLNRFQGTWYEIAKLPRHTETGCRGTTATYRLRSGGKLDVQSECTVDGVPRRMIAEAVVSDPDTPAKLSLDVGGFYGDYWILEVGKDYEYAVVGHPAREYLWILSRTPALTKSDLAPILDRSPCATIRRVAARIHASGFRSPEGCRAGGIRRSARIRLCSLPWPQPFQLVVRHPERARRFLRKSAQALASAF